MHIQTKLNKQRAAENRFKQAQQVLADAVQKIGDKVREASDARWKELCSGTAPKSK